MTYGGAWRAPESCPAAQRLSPRLPAHANAPVDDGDSSATAASSRGPGSADIGGRVAFGRCVAAGERMAADDCVACGESAATAFGELLITIDI